VQIDKGSILDIGAGTGDFLSVAKKRWLEYYGIEPSDRAKLLLLVKEFHLSIIRQPSRF
jgi:ubiquinone/menaquinone biosynthesis C-methylase UbiE